MSGGDDKMQEAIEDLWTEVFGQPPAIRCDPHLLAEVLVRSLSPPPPYGDPPFMRDREPLRPAVVADVTKSPSGSN